MNEAEKIWERLLSAVESALPPKEVEIWLKNSCSPARAEGGRLVLEAGNDFVAKRVRDKYLAALEEAMAAEGLGTGVDIAVSESASPPPPERAPAVKPPISPNGLNRQYDFASFVVGKSNRLAHAASLAVAEEPGRAYNPLFIWGGVGLGKTHLMHAIGNYALGQYPNMKVTYLSSEKFTNDLITAIKNNRQSEFRARYRSVDILLIDDIQFLAGKPGIQEEFFHTFNDLHDAKKQIVLSSDRPPKELDDIEERIVSRFVWGFVGDIQQPDYETRIAILKKKADQRRIPVNDDVIAFLAEKIPTNIRELEGALNRVVASANFSQQPITVENALLWLKDVIDTKSRGMISFDLIMDLVAGEFGYTPEDICGKRRTADLALARQTAMYLCRGHTESSLTQIARDFGKKDHTTVLHAIRKIELLLKEDPRVKRIVENIEKKL